MAPRRLWSYPYLQFSSHHPTYVKRGFVKCLYNRSREVTNGNGQAMTDEEDFLHDILRGNGYDDEFVHESMTPSGLNNCQDPPKIITFIPYFEGLSDDIYQICRKFNIHTFFRSVTNIRKRLLHSKDPIPAEKRRSSV